MWSLLIILAATRRRTSHCPKSLRGPEESVPVRSHFRVRRRHSRCIPKPIFSIIYALFKWLLTTPMTNKSFWWTTGKGDKTGWKWNMFRVQLLIYINKYDELLSCNHTLYYNAAHQLCSSRTHVLKWTAQVSRYWFVNTSGWLVKWWVMWLKGLDSRVRLIA